MKKILPLFIFLLFSSLAFSQPKIQNPALLTNYTENIRMGQNIDRFNSLSYLPLQVFLSAGAYCNDSLGLIACQVYNGNTPYSYLWNTGDTISILDSISAGDYFVTVTDSLGFVVIDSVMGFNPVPLSADLSYPSTGCIPTLASIDVTGGSSPYVIHWSTGTYNTYTMLNSSGPYSVTVQDNSGCSITDYFSITHDTTLFIDGSGVITLDTCSNLPGSIELTLDASSYPVSFNWTDNQTTQNVDSLHSGYYTVIMTNPDGCYLSLNFSIPLFPNLDAFVSSSYVTDCQLLNNGSAYTSIVAGVPPYSFQWSIPSTGTMLTNVGPGNYYVTISDYCDTQIDSVTVEYSFPVNFQIEVQNAYCNTNSGKIEITGYNLMNIDSFYVQDIISGDIFVPSSNYIIDSLPVSDYTLTLIDIYGCDSILPIHIGFVPVDFDFEIDSAVCQGNIVSADAMFYSPYTDTAYTYYDIEEIPFSTEDMSLGTTISSNIYDDKYYGPFNIGFDFNFFDEDYNQFWVGTNGWISFSPSSSSNFDPWQTNAIPNSEAFHPRNAIFALYRDWYIGNSMISDITYYISGTAPNRKLVVNYIDVPLFSCTSIYGNFQIVLYEGSDIIDVNIIDGPTCLQWNGGRGVSGIQNAEGTLAYVIDSLNNTSFEAYNFSLRYTPCRPQWFDPNGNLIAEGSNVSFVAESTGTYSVETCTYCGFEVKEFEINYQYLFTPNSQLPADTSMCQGQSLSLFGANNTAYTYLWNTGESTDLITIDTIGLYEVTITDNIGCISIHSVFVDEQGLAISAFDFTEAFNHVQFTNLSQNANSYIWDFGDGTPVSNEINPVHDYPASSQNIWYTVTLTSINQCGEDSSNTQIITFDLEELDGNSQIGVFPNPNKGNFYIKGTVESSKEVIISIYNSSGQKVYTKEIVPKSGKILQEIQMNDVSAGLYYLVLQQANKKWVHKLMVE